MAESFSELSQDAAMLCFEYKLAFVGFIWMKRGMDLFTVCLFTTDLLALFWSSLGLLFVVFASSR